MAPEVFTGSELGGASDAIDALIDERRAGNTSDPDYWECPLDHGEEPILYRIHRLEAKTSWPARLASQRVFAELLSDVFEGPATPTQCALTIKMPGAGVRVPWHRDPVVATPGSVYNFSIYLDESTVDNGCLHIRPGSHLEDRPVEDAMPRHVVPVQAGVGDVVIHDVRVEHGSPESMGGPRRRAIVIEFTRGGPASGTRAEAVFGA